MARALMIAALALLAACGTPRDRCISRATKDLRVVDALIAELQLNIQRGYALETRQTSRVVAQFCTGRDDDGIICLRDRIDTKTVPVAIDIEAERAKLAWLEVKRRELAAKAQRDLAACETEFAA